MSIRVHPWLVFLAFSFAAAGGAEIAQHVILLEPSETELAVTESFFFNNPAVGTLQVRIPDAAKDTIQAIATGPDSLPVQLSAGKTGKPNTYKIDFPIKPGDTRIDVSYRLPFTSPGKFATRLLHKETLTRLVAPPGVEIKGAGLEELGLDPRSQARIFGVKGPSIEVEIQGTGSIRAAETAPEDEESGPGIKQILPRLYDRVWLIVGIALTILALGFVMLYRRGAPAQPAAPARPETPPSGKAIPNRPAAPAPQPDTPPRGEAILNRPAAPPQPETPPRGKRRS